MHEGLIIEDLHLSLRAPDGGSPGGSSGSSARPVLSGVGLTVAPGEFVALVGASGSGKTMTALSVLGLLPPQIRAASGSITLGGTDLLAASGAELNRLRGGRIGMLYQQPKRMFNPRMTIGSHLAEPLKLHRGLRGRKARAQAVELLSNAGFEDPERVARGYPHQLSGGMAQRAMLAVAMAGQPELLLADEPTSALDKVLERQILELIDQQRRQHGLGVLYITHDLATVSAFADRVVVMDAGRVQEEGPARSVLGAPQTACARELLEACALTRRRIVVAGEALGLAPSRDILALEGVTKRFAKGRGARPALEDVSLSLREGEILGVLGQSGSGKSTLARLLVEVETPDHGSITRTLPAGDGKDDGGTASRGVPGTEVQLVFQEPHDAFDPRMKLFASLEAPLLRQRTGAADGRRERIRQAVRDVELDPGLLDRYPSQCSGGQLQRLTIARALLLDPAVLICDEATSALDAVTQRKVLDLLLRLHRDRRLSLIMISHDMNVIRYMSHRVAVLYKGALVELAGTSEFFANPQHGHSKELVAAARAHPAACAAPVACSDLAACAHRVLGANVVGGRPGTSRSLELVSAPDA
ncbi:UNVERIFIED_ORG: peptide/nickel transport system ATP-binding protein [Arthrobacter globiformis]|nr:peptide/nickel transport system ATP-binding protein [Arthrobacter globiformis]